MINGTLITNGTLKPRFIIDESYCSRGATEHNTQERIDDIPVNYGVKQNAFFLNEISTGFRFSENVRRQHKPTDLKSKHENETIKEEKD